MFKKWISLTAITLIAVLLFNMFGTSLLFQGYTTKRIIEANKTSLSDQYDDYFDELIVQELEDGNYKIHTNKKLAKPIVKGIKYTSEIEINSGIIGDDSNQILNDEIEEVIESYEEEIEISSEVDYNPAKEKMVIDLSITDENGNAENIDVVAKPQIDSEGNITGTATINGTVYGIEDIMEEAAKNELDECVVPVVLIFNVVSAIIGGVIGGIGAYNVAKAKKMNIGGQAVYVVGGIVIGVIAGKAIDVATGQLGSVVLAKLGKIGKNITEATGFTSFYYVKKALGDKKAGFQYHHLVQQGWGNIEKFGVKKIHNTKNVVQISDELHAKITSHYAKKYKGKYDNETFAKYMSKKSYEEQYKTATEILHRYAEELSEKVVYN